MRSPATPHLAIALALLVGACSGPADSPTPTATAAPAPSVVSTAAPSLFPTASALPSAPSTAQPTAAPSPASAAIEFPTEVGFVNQFVMKVAVSDLNVRAKPTTKSASIGKAPKGGLFMMADTRCRLTRSSRAIFSRRLTCRPPSKSATFRSTRSCA